MQSLEDKFMRKIKRPKPKNKRVEIEQPQCLNLELCYDDYINETTKKYGLKAKQKFGDIVVETKLQENLENIIDKHYRKTKFRDARTSVNDLKNLFIAAMVPKEKKKVDQTLTIKTE